MFDDVITVINRYRLNGKEAFKKHEVHNCMWKESVTKFMSNGVVTNAKEITVSILFQADYLPPKAYEVDRENHFTLQESDYIVLGEVKEDISTSAQLKEVLSKYDHVGIITSVIDSTNVKEQHMKKWKVIAKCQ